MRFAHGRRGRCSGIGFLAFVLLVVGVVLWANERGGNVAIFSGQNRRVTDDFRGADITTIFGGNKLDLREATMPGDEAVLHLTNIFGGSHILVPDDWQVVNESSTIFGGFNDTTRHSSLRSAAPRLIIEGATIFGGTKVQN